MVYTIASVWDLLIILNPISTIEESCNRKLVFNRSADLIQNKSILPFTVYQKAAIEIKVINLQWPDKMMN